jgi:uncharacterized tellurite resistance protein B-like protein
MKLPALLEENFVRLDGRAPKRVIRALYDITGELGATWLAVGDEHLAFFHRPSGGEFGRLKFRLNEVIECGVHSDSDLALIRFRFATAQYELRCSLFDIPRLDAITAQCRTTNLANPIQPPARLNAMSAFCAGIQAVLEADGQVDPLETEWLCQKIADPVSIEQGSAWLRANGAEPLIAEINRHLSPEQRECLLANQIAAVMADGLLEADERESVERFRKAMEISPERFDQLFEVLLTRNQVALMADPGTGNVGPYESPLRLFTACLIALTQCDESRCNSENAYLRRVLGDNALLEEGAKLLDEVGVEALLARLPGPFTPEQSRCLVANMLAVAMVDGELAIEEQELTERVRLALGIPDDEFARQYDVLLTKNNLCVLS